MNRRRRSRSNKLTRSRPDERGRAVGARRAVRAAEKWDELADNIGRQLSMAERGPLAFPDAAARAPARNAHGSIGPAIEIYREVLDRDPACAPR